MQICFMHDSEVCSTMTKENDDSHDVTVQLVHIATYGTTHGRVHIWCSPCDSLAAWGRCVVCSFSKPWSRTQVHQHKPTWTNMKQHQQVALPHPPTPTLHGWWFFVAGGWEDGRRRASHLALPRTCLAHAMASSNKIHQVMGWGLVKWPFMDTKKSIEVLGFLDTSSPSLKGWCWMGSKNCRKPLASCSSDVWQTVASFWSIRSSDSTTRPHRDNIGLSWALFWWETAYRMNRTTLWYSCCMMLR